MAHNHDHSPSHFKGKDALGHVIEAQAQGLVAAAEMHGTEPAGYLSAASDAARDTAIFLPLVCLLLSYLQVSAPLMLTLLSILAGSLMLWKIGRGAWLGWFRLERLHRILEQERWEIEHHRQQERDELRVLYAAKGFEGKLLEDVLDVLMADNPRLLKVMVEEELGLSLAASEHPLKQGLGAGIGVLVTATVCLALFALWPFYGIFLGALVMISGSAIYIAYLTRNEAIPAVIWNIGLSLLAYGWVYFLLSWLQLALGNV